MQHITVEMHIQNQRKQKHVQMIQCFQNKVLWGIVLESHDMSKTTISIEILKWLWLLMRDC